MYASVRKTNLKTTILVPPGVLRITSDGDDRRIFGGFNFRLRGCLGRKIWQVFFRWFDLSRDF